MCWKEHIQWQSVAYRLRKEHVLRPPFLDKVLHHFFFLWLSVHSSIAVKAITKSLDRSTGLNFMLHCYALTGVYIGHTNLWIVYTAIHLMTHLSWLARRHNKCLEKWIDKWWIHSGSKALS